MGMQFFGRLHPLVVHLPIGLLVLVAFLELLTLSPRYKDRIDPVLGIIVRIAALSALVAGGFGLVLGTEGGHPEKLLSLHRKLGVVTTILSVLLAAGWNRIPRIVYRVLLVATMGTLAVGSHFGGVMTHGESWLFPKPPPPPTPVSAKEPWEHLVLPVLQSKCISCHGPDVQKGDLRLDTWEAFDKEGADTIVSRVRAPLDDDDHMPPAKKPQLTQQEKDRIELWYKSK